jgi:hypothetical protein
VKGSVLKGGEQGVWGEASEVCREGERRTLCGGASPPKDHHPVFLGRRDMRAGSRVAPAPATR